MGKTSLTHIHTKPLFHLLRPLLKCGCPFILYVLFNLPTGVWDSGPWWCMHETTREMSCPFIHCALFTGPSDPVMVVCSWNVLPLYSLCVIQPPHRCMGAYTLQGSCSSCVYPAPLIFVHYSQCMGSSMHCSGPVVVYGWRNVVTSSTCKSTPEVHVILYVHYSDAWMNPPLNVATPIINLYISPPPPPQCGHPWCYPILY